MTCRTFITTMLLVAELCQCGTESCESINECVWLQRFVCVCVCVCGAVTLALWPFVTCHSVCGQAWKKHAHIHRFTDAFTSWPRQLPPTTATHTDTHSYALVVVEAEHQCRQVLVCLLMTDIGRCFQSHHQTSCYLQAFLINNTIFWLLISLFGWRFKNEVV